MAKPFSTISHRAAGRSAAVVLTAGVGAVFLLVGVLGFIPGVTTHFGQMAAAGHESGAELLGVFRVSILHNLVHLLYGVVGLLAARTVASARAYLMIGGAIYLVLWLYGMIIDRGSVANVIPVNSADNWLHLGLGLGMLVLGLLVTRSATGPGLSL